MNNYYNGFVPNSYYNVPYMRGAISSAPARGLAGLFTRSSPSVLGGIGARSAIPAVGSASKITFGGILSGASKTLNVINQAIPVFYQIKPMWNNAKTMFKVVRAVNDDKPARSNVKKEQTSIKESSDNPTFFL